MTTSIQSLGGKARAANMTPEERTAAARHAATKGARKLGREGRRARALKGVATRKARAERCQLTKGCVFNPQHRGPCHIVDPTNPNWIIASSDRSAHIETSHCEGAEASRIEHQKRSEPKAGTLNARVLSVMRREPKRLWRSEEIEERVIPCQKVGNTLSSLRSAGHVVSEPKPGSRREKLWRLA